MEVSYPGRSLGPTGRFLKGILWWYLGQLGPLRNRTSPKNLLLDFLKLNFLSPALAVTLSPLIPPSPNPTSLNPSLPSSLPSSFNLVSLTPLTH